LSFAVESKRPQNLQNSTSFGVVVQNKWKSKKVW